MDAIMRTQPQAPLTLAVSTGYRQVIGSAPTLVDFKLPLIMLF